MNEEVTDVKFKAPQVEVKRPPQPTNREIFKGSEIRLGEGNLLDPSVIASYVPESPWGKMQGEALERHREAVRTAEVFAIVEVFAGPSPEQPGILQAVGNEAKRLVDAAKVLEGRGRITEDEMFVNLGILFESYRPHPSIDGGFLEYEDSDGIHKTVDLTLEGGMNTPTGLHIRYTETKIDERWGDISLRVPFVTDEGGRLTSDPAGTRVLGSEGVLKGITLPQAADHVVSTANIAARYFEANSRKVQDYLDSKSRTP